LKTVARELVGVEEVKSNKGGIDPAYCYNISYGKWNAHLLLGGPFVYTRETDQSDQHLRGYR
jgi:hypothetical protein